MDSFNLESFLVGLGVGLGIGLGGIVIRVLWESRKVRLEHKLQIMREMTTTFHELSQDYVHLAQAAYELARAIEYKANNEVPFFKLARFLLEYERLPIVQLKCVLAESTFNTIAFEIFKLLRDEANILDEDFIHIQEIDSCEKLVDFKRKLNVDVQLKGICNKFNGLLTVKSAEFRELLLCFADLILMETTCGKDTWYEKKDILEQAKETMSSLNMLPHLNQDVKSQGSKYYSYLMGKYKAAWYKRAWYKRAWYKRAWYKIMRTPDKK